MRRLAIVSLAAFLLLSWPERISTATWEYEDSGGFKSYEERVEFKKLLKKHGLHHQISVIYGWPDKPYYIEKGRKVNFK